MTMPENPVTGRETPMPSVSAMPKNIAEQLDLLVACAKPASGQNSAYVAVGIVRDYIADLIRERDEAEADAQRVRNTLSLHAGDVMSLDNEVRSMREQRDELQSRLSAVEARMRELEQERNGAESIVRSERHRADKAEATIVAPVYPAAGWLQKPVGRDEVPRLVADIASRSRDGEPVATRDLFNRAIDVLCRVEDARREAVDATS